MSRWLRVGWRTFEVLPGAALILGAAVVQAVGAGTIVWWAWQWWVRR